MKVSRDSHMSHQLLFFDSLLKRQLLFHDLLLKFVFLRSKFVVTFPLFKAGILPLLLRADFMERSCDNI